MTDVVAEHLVWIRQRGWTIRQALGALGVEAITRLGWTDVAEIYEATYTAMIDREVIHTIQTIHRGHKQRADVLLPFKQREREVA